METPTPFGRWPSPLGPRTVAAGRSGRSSLSSDGRCLYWVENRPEEGGRQVVVRASVGGTPVEVTPPGTSVRSRVHEYGGGAYCLVPGDPPSLAYVEQADQRVRRIEADRAAVELSPPPPPGERWAHGDLRCTPDGRWVLCVRERQLGGPPAPVRRELVGYRAAPAASGGVPGAGEAAVVLVHGRDFYSAPRPDPSGHRIAWTCWDHPDMPWGASELWVGELTAEVGAPGLSVRSGQHVDGGRAEGVSVGQPLWDAHGGLVYASDRGGWWRPWRWDPRGGRRPLVADEAEYHGPDWVLGQSTMAEITGGALACRRRRDGVDRLVLLDAVAGTWRGIDQPCVSIGAVCAHGAGVAWLGATASTGTALWWWSADAAPAVAVVSSPPLLPGRDVSTAEAFTCASRDGRGVHGLFFPPRLAGVGGPPGELPPLVVHCHGGPTGSAEAGFDPVVQLFTTRGFAVAVVDYAGSVGHGRAYRQALAGRWGEADVDDCVDAARFLAAAGRVDGGRMAIRGSSAGGFTALGALARSDAFAAAVAWYAVTDLLAMAATTHDFEAHYTDWLVGPLPQAADQYRRRSPVNRTADMKGAVLLFQGLDDPVVPPAQAAAMADALRARGHPCELVTFPGESHGFRRADTVERCLQAELDFYVDRLCRP